MMARTILKKIFSEKSNYKIINLFCSISQPKLTPGYNTDYYFHFPPTPAKFKDFILLKSPKTMLFFSYSPLLSMFLYVLT